MLHHQGDLVAVAGEHDPRLAAGVEDGQDVAVAVGADLVGVLLGPGSHHLLDAALEAGGARGVEEVFEKGEGRFLHCSLVLFFLPSPLAGEGLGVRGQGRRHKG